MGVSTLIDFDNAPGGSYAVVFWNDTNHNPLSPVFYVDGRAQARELYKYVRENSDGEVRKLGIDEWRELASEYREETGNST